MVTTAALRGIYLNDHLAGATAGVELFRRGAAARRGTAAGAALERLTAEVAEDRASLRAVMGDLDVPVRHYKLIGGWGVERLGRLKSNGHLLSRSPLSDLVELEGMRLGVQGKHAGWRSLRVWADAEPRLDPVALDALAERAERQAAELEELRVAAAAALVHPAG